MSYADPEQQGLSVDQQCISRDDIVLALGDLGLTHKVDAWLRDRPASCFNLKDFEACIHDLAKYELCSLTTVLPLNDLLAFCLDTHMGHTEESLRRASSLDAFDLDAVNQLFSLGLKRLLTDQLRKLQCSFQAADARSGAHFFPVCCPR
jgi:hypothetical protein